MNMNQLRNILDESIDTYCIDNEITPEQFDESVSTIYADLLQTLLELGE